MSTELANIESLGITDFDHLKKMGEHEIGLKGYSIAINNESQIFRYVRLSFLIDFITHNRMFVPSIRQFADLTERYGCKKCEDHQMIRPCPSYKSKLRIKQRIKEMDKTLTLCAKCWTLDKRTDGSIEENILMWKSYSSNEIVCRIGTTIADIVNSIEHIDSDILFADVIYGRNRNLKVNEELLLNKSIHYDHEQEVRMLYLEESPTGSYIEVNATSMLKSITISPFVHPETASFIISQLRNICMSNPKIKMSKSSINEYDGELPEYMKKDKVGL